MLPEERVNGQDFIVDIILNLDLSKAGNSDNINDTINYAMIYERVSEIVLSNKFQLIEKLAESICSKVLLEYSNICLITVTVKKPQAPIDGMFDYMSVEVTRITSYNVCYTKLLRP